jgi:hypothetical protein
MGGAGPLLAPICYPVLNHTGMGVARATVTYLCDLGCVRGPLYHLDF